MTASEKRMSRLIEMADGIDGSIYDDKAIARGLRMAALQARVLPWMLECFGPTIPFDKTERNHRFLEEAIELVQACGASRGEAHQLVDYVFDRDQGDVNQEVGGVMITLAALCIANGFDMHEAGETELARIWTKVEQIRAKQATKPKHSPLPAAPSRPDCPYLDCPSPFVCKHGCKVAAGERE